MGSSISSFNYLLLADHSIESALRCELDGLPLELQTRSGIGARMLAWQIRMEARAEQVLVRLRSLAARYPAASVGLIRSSPISGLFFDLDATVIEEESLVQAAQVLGTDQQEIARLTDLAMAGGMTFEDSLRRRIDMLKGTPTRKVADVAATLTIRSGIKEVVEWCQQRSIPCFLVTGGFHEIADPIADQLGFSGVWANRLGTQDGKLDGTITGELVDGISKATFLQRRCRELGCGSRAAMGIGDGANDRWMLSLCGTAIGLSPKAALNPVLHAWNRTDCHRLLLDVLSWNEEVASAG